MLDIIVTHYNEPWKIGKKFFDMLGCQRGIDFNSFQVILVHDGTDVFPKRMMADYPYKITQYRIPHAGVSAARNYGLDRATDKWVQFCDFDDMYSDAFSLMCVMQQMDKDVDYMWTPFLTEVYRDGQIAARDTMENIVFVHGKYFRREWLKEHNIRFPEGIHYSEDSAFCAIVNELAENHRRGQIKTKFPVYIWCVRKDSVSMNPQNERRNLTGFIDRNFYVVEEFIRRGIPHTLMVGRMFADAYWAFHRKDIQFPEEEKRFAEKAKGYAGLLGKISEKDMAAIMRAARINFIRQTDEKAESFADWVKRVC